MFPNTPQPDIRERLAGDGREAAGSAAIGAGGDAMTTTHRNGSLLRDRLHVPPPPSCERVRASDLAGTLLAILVVLLTVLSLWTVTP